MSFSKKKKSGELLADVLEARLLQSASRSLGAGAREPPGRLLSKRKKKNKSWVGIISHPRFTMSHTTQTQPLTLIPLHSLHLTDKCRKLDFETYRGLHTNTRGGGGVGGGGSWKMVEGEL